MQANTKRLDLLEELEVSYRYAQAACECLGGVTPTVVGIKQDGEREVHTVTNAMRDARSKTILAAIVKGLLSTRVYATVVIISEAWTVLRDPATFTQEMMAKGLKDEPDKREIVLFQVLTLDVTRFAEADMQRTEDRVTLGPLVVREGCQTLSRFFDR